MYIWSTTCCISCFCDLYKIINSTGKQFRCETLGNKLDFDAIHVLIINLLHNITNIDLCGGDILGNISGLVSVFTVTLTLLLLLLLIAALNSDWNVASDALKWRSCYAVISEVTLEETMGDWPGRWVGEVHLWDKAEALQWYSHHSKLHSANKEKTINKRKRKKPSDDKITGSTGWPSTSGFFLFNNNNNNINLKKKLHCALYAM